MPKPKSPKRSDSGKLQRTHFSNELNIELAGQKVTITGWVQRIRRFGKISFLLVRDRAGITQCTLPHAKTAPELLEMLDTLDNEYAIVVKGEVKARRIDQPPD